MYSIQKGVIPAITGIASFVLPAWVFILDMKYIFENLNTRIPEIMGNAAQPIWAVVVMLLFFTLFFPLYFGMLLASIFPVVEVRRDGIKFTYWAFFGSKVAWSEIDSLVYYSNGYVVLRIDKYGLPILNGLYFNKLLAGFIKSQLPILIFSPGLEKREELINEIVEKSSPRVVRKN